MSSTGSVCVPLSGMCAIDSCDGNNQKGLRGRFLYGKETSLEIQRREQRANESREGVTLAGRSGDVRFNGHSALIKTCTMTHVCYFDAQ